MEAMAHFLKTSVKIIAINIYRGWHSSPVLDLSISQCRGPGFDSGLEPSCVELICSPGTSAWVFTRYSGFFPRLLSTFQKHAWSLKQSIWGVCECEWFCPCVPCDCVATSSECTLPSVWKRLGEGSSLPAILVRITGLYHGWMARWTYLPISLIGKYALYIPIYSIY